MGIIIATFAVTLFGAFSTIDDTDRYRPQDAERDLAVLEERLDSLERRIDTAIAAMRREHEWMRSRGYAREE